MEQNTEVKGNTIIRHELVWRGYHPQQAYKPQVQKKADAVVTSHYLHGQKLYNPMKWHEDWRISEHRKECMRAVVNARIAIRNKVEMWQKDKDTRLVGITAAQKTAIRSERLLSNLVTAKHIV